MRKIYSLLLALVATCICTTAALADISLTINVDDATRVKILDYDDVEQTIVTGDNVFSCGDNEMLYLYIYPASGDFGITSVKQRLADGTESTLNAGYSGYVSVILRPATSYSASTDGATYTVTSFSYAAARTDTCIVKVDDASKVTLNRRNYTAIPLLNGENKVAFIPASAGSSAEVPFSISANGTIYEVLLNGEKLTSNYDINIKKGDTLDIKANWPDKDIPVKFIAGDEDSKGFIQRVTVNGTEVSDWDTENFTVKMGSEIYFTCNTTDYKADSIFINGEKEQYFYGNGTLYAHTEEAQTVTYYAHKYASYNITINIDHADRVTINRKVGYSSSAITGLTDGENTVTLSEQVTGLSFSVKGGCWIESFTNQEGTEYKDYSSYQSIPVKEGDVFTITTGEVERNASFVCYIDDPSLSTSGGNLTFTAGGNYQNQSVILPLLDGNNKPIAGGYYTFNFDPGYDNPLQINTWGVDPYIYQCDTLVGQQSSARITVADKDVVKVFCAGKPETLNVTFTVEEGAAPSVVRDLIIPVEDFTETLPVLTGTQIDIKALSVKANGEDVVADENGVFSVIITANTTIEIAGDAETSIQNTNTGLNRNVYTLQGMLLIKDATPAQINALPAGLYIISGKTTYLLQH